MCVVARNLNLEILGLALCVCLSLSLARAFFSPHLLRRTSTACYCSSSVNGITASHCLRLRHRRGSYRSPFYVGSTPSTHPPLLPPFVFLPSACASFALLSLCPSSSPSLIYTPTHLLLPCPNTFPSLFSAVGFDRNREPWSSSKGHLYLFDPSLL